MITYNHAKFIRQAIESILIQNTDFTYEIIIGDDCSTDGTGEILLEYQERYPTILKCIIRDKNIGAQPNWIQTFNSCKGKYIACLEGDDYWLNPLKLQKQIDFLEANLDYSICFHEIHIEKYGQLIEDYITKVPAETTTQTDLLTKNYIHTPSVVFRNKLVDIPEWFNNVIPGDYILWLMLTNNGSKIKHITSKMGVYRVHAGGIWSLQDRSKYKQRVLVSMLVCAKYLKISNKNFVSGHTIALIDSIATEGFKDISFNKYLKLIIWHLINFNYSPRQIYHILKRIQTSILLSR